MAEDLENQQNDKIIPINIEEQMKSAYIDYSMSVIVSRALPDVRDGLKPVHRRVLYGMLDLGVTSNKQQGFSKCPAIEAAIAEYRKLSDSVALFLEDGGFEPSLDDFKSLKDVFSSYRLFCQQGNYTSCSERTFSDRLKGHGYQVVRKSAGRVIGIARHFHN